MNTTINRIKTMFKAIFQFLSGIINDLNRDKIWDSKDGISKTKINGKYGFINDNGESIVKPYFDMVYDFNDDLALVELNGKYGFINKKGEVAIDLKFDFAYSFHRGYAIVKIKKKWGVINESGNMILQPIFDDITGPDKHGEAFFATLKGKFGIVDKNSNFTQL
ncbi:WG repeat-containing protein [Campylobacter coli]|uniref:WG repeat-containing protein n=3 Tax=Campylobacter coli TaxID=195 RepID=A0A3Z9VBG9_CAMCO|nr:hypothetical protein BU815_07790 [Campylobacter coli]EIA94948.1 KWG repeat protein [Campylobacter coli LMG 23341]EIA95446.1 KWG repeat protein [Campylobacter coli LMG 23342]EAC1764305.1 WG repeat-containing protein [Campylobacter coli]EAH4673407.1 WG repeat-containing protein [Campylobacter coli]